MFGRKESRKHNGLLNRNIAMLESDNGMFASQKLGLQLQCGK